jgi:hypothetical protein
LSGVLEDKGNHYIKFALLMIYLRLISEHSYKEEVAEEIYRQVGDCWKLMDRVCRLVVEKLRNDKNIISSIWLPILSLMII